jgi:N-acetylglucosaminyldiphosphoundecaprenol N-acetyl-beta-D-mannosaminyltransferase
MKKVYFDDLAINNLNLKTVVSAFKNLVLQKSKKPRWAVCLNTHNINLSYEDKEYRLFIKKADLVIPDGWGVVWAGKILGYRLQERTTTADYFDQFCQMLSNNKLSVYFLGSKETVIKKAVAVLKKQFPKLKILGFHSGYFREKQEKKIIDTINRLKPDFLLLGMGTPKQEKWLWRYQDKLKVKVGWGVGAIFDYLVGAKKRCPVWLGRLGLEWLFRLLCEPRRLWRRYILGSFKFITLCLKIYRKKKEH